MLEGVGDAHGRVDPWAIRALAAIATATAALAIAEPGESPARPLVLGLGGFALALVGAGVVHAWQGQRPLRDGTVAILLLGSLVLPFAVTAVQGVVWGRTDPLEILLLAALRDLGVGLAVGARQPRLARPAAVVSLFLLLVASCLAEGDAVIGLMVAYAVVGGAWLAATHWRGLRLPVAAQTRSRPPWMGAGLAVLLVLAGAGVVAVGPGRAATILAGLVPSSGGTTWDDPDARGGVGDGENEVKGSEKPESIGFTESDVYLDSDRPALYDAFNDMYGEPSKPKNRERMVALANPNVQEQRQGPAENLRAGRQFAAVRNRPIGPSRRPSDREAKALVYVKGPAPLHLGLATYDRFDGRAWTEEPASARAFPFTVGSSDGVNPWMERDQAHLPHLAGPTVRHQIKVGALDSSPMPLPPHLDRFRIGRVNRADFFGWAQDGVVRMAGRTVPAGTLIETVCRVVDPQRLRDVAFPPAKPPTGTGSDPAVRQLARAWADGHPRGWTQVEAVVGKVREHAQHDRGEVAPSDCDDVVAHFLFDARRAPDYLFATAASALLRELGYTTRLVSGLYADPVRYDARTRHVPVAEESVHTWLEVRLPCGDWATVEPTPGYAVLLPERSWAGVLIDFGRDHAGGLGLGFVGVLVLVRLRRELADRVATLAWRGALRFDPGRGPVRTLRLLEGRARRAGLPRPPGWTPRRWYGPLAPAREPELVALLALVERHLYAPTTESAPAPGDPLALCRRVAGGWTLPTFRALARQAGPPSEAFA